MYALWLSHRRLRNMLLGSLFSLKYYQLFLESDRSHDEARYRLPDNYVTLKPITDADNRCLIFVNPDAQRHKVLSPLGPRRLRRSKGGANVSFRGSGDGDIGGAL